MSLDPAAPYRAVLFDFDGTLASTMEDNYRAWQFVLHAAGADILREEYFLLEGMKLAEVARTLCEKNGVVLPDYSDLVRRKEDYYLEHHTFGFYAGVEPFITELASAGVPMAIVTAGLYDRIVGSVPAIFLNQFKVVVTGEKTERNKPFPDPYLKAAEEIGIPIGECLVVENAPLGIRSAKAAGAACIAISSTLNPALLAEADVVVPRFEDIMNLPAMTEIMRRGRSMFESSV